MAPERAGPAYRERTAGRIDAARLKVMADIEACRIIEFAIGQQSGVGGHSGTVEVQLQAEVEIQPQRLIVGFTLRVRHRPCLQVHSTH